MNQHAVPVSLKFPGEMKAGGLFNDVSVGLVSNTEDKHRSSGRNYSPDLLQQIRLGQLIDFVRRFRQGCLQSDLARGIRKQPVVAWKTRTTKTQSSTQIFISNSGIGSDGVKNHVDVGLRKLLGDHSKLVRKADLHSDVTIHRDLGKLSADDRHPGDPRFVSSVLSVKLFQRRAAVPIALS